MLSLLLLHLTLCVRVDVTILSEYAKKIYWSEGVGMFSYIFRQKKAIYNLFVAFEILKILKAMCTCVSQLTCDMSHP